MKSKLIICIALAFVMLTSLSAIAVTPSESSPSRLPAAARKEKVLEARFLNMLNHSFAYDEDLESIEKLANLSVPALLELAEGDYIDEAYVNDYIFNLYGVSCEDFSALNSSFPKKEGYLYIIPRGYSLYKHTFDSVTKNEDGSYTVVTDLVIDSHDGIENTKAVTLFVPNDASSFGFNIISSEISSDIETL